MSHDKASKAQGTRLSESEGSSSRLFDPVFTIARGRYGPFGQNDRADPEGRYSGWHDAKRLKNLAQEIKIPRHGFGQPNEVCERFVQLCSQRGPNVPGEPKLVAAFLAELSVETND